VKHVDFSVVRCAVVASPGFTKVFFLVTQRLSKFTWFIIFQIAAGPGLQISHTYMTQTV